MEFSTVLGPRTSQKVPQSGRSCEEFKRRESLAREAHNELLRGLRLAYNLSRDKRPSRLWSRQGCTSSTALSSTMRSSRKRQTFSMLLLVSRTGTYVHVLNVEYLADKFDSFLRNLHALCRYMEKEFDKVDICKETLNI